MTGSSLAHAIKKRDALCEEWFKLMKRKVIVRCFAREDNGHTHIEIDAFVSCPTGDQDNEPNRIFHYSYGVAIIPRDQEPFSWGSDYKSFVPGENDALHLKLADWGDFGYKDPFLRETEFEGLWGVGRSEVGDPIACRPLTADHPNWQLPLARAAMDIERHHLFRQAEARTSDAARNAERNGFQRLHARMSPFVAHQYDALRRR